METTERVHLIDEQFKGHFVPKTVPGLFDRLWLLIVDQWKEDKKLAFTVALPRSGFEMDNHQFMLGIAEEGTTGYYPTYVYFDSNNYDVCSNVADALTKAVWGHNQETAIRISLSSMGNPHKKAQLN